MLPARGEFRKRPVVVRAIRFDGQNTEEIAEFLEVEFEGDGGPIDSLVIATLEGDMRAQAGDWIIEGLAGELYPCHPDVFESTYDCVREL